MVAKLTLVGNLGVEPEAKLTADGRPFVVCRVASNYRRRDPETQEWADQTNWYRVTVFGRLAERMTEQVHDGRLTKGAHMIVFGRLEAGAYLDRNNKAQASLDVIADDLMLLESRREDDDSMSGGGRDIPSSGRQQRPAKLSPTTDLSTVGNGDDDPPF